MPQWPVALGYGIRDVQEGRAHQVEGFVREGWYILWRHALCLDLWKDLQSDGPCGGGKKLSDILWKSIKKVNCLQLQKWGKPRSIKRSYLIWTAFLSVGKSCCMRKTRRVWWVPEKTGKYLRDEELSKTLSQNITIPCSCSVHKSEVIRPFKLSLSTPKEMHDWSSITISYTHTIGKTLAAPTPTRDL